MNNRYNTANLYRIWTSQNDAARATYTGGHFNAVTTGRFICHVHNAAKVRPVEVWVQCPECECEAGWIPVDDILEIAAAQWVMG
jgi:hypothetical protein